MHARLSYASAILCTRALRIHTPPSGNHAPFLTTSDILILQAPFLYTSVLQSCQAAILEDACTSCANKHPSRNQEPFLSASVLRGVPQQFSFPSALLVYKRLSRIQYKRAPCAQAPFSHLSALLVYKRPFRVHAPSWCTSALLAYRRASCTQAPFQSQGK